MLNPIKYTQSEVDSRSLIKGTEDVEKLLHKYTILFSSVVIKDEGVIVVTLKDKSEVIISSQKNIEFQIASLQLMISRFTIEGVRFKRIDFRFDKPVVAFNAS